MIYYPLVLSHLRQSDQTDMVIFSNWGALFSCSQNRLRGYCSPPQFQWLYKLPGRHEPGAKITQIIDATGLVNNTMSVF